MMARPPYEHVISVSGGVDSGATLLRAVERGRPFVACFADTENEHPAVYEHIDYLESKLGMKIQRVKADLTERIAARRVSIAEKWPEKGVPADIVERALSVMHPTGNAFLDLCLSKNRFPSMKARFCTEELKIIPIQEQVYLPIWRAGRAVISWQGVRADESRARALLSKWQQVNPYSSTIEISSSWRTFAYRPILEWKKSQCFALYEKHGLKANALYSLGFGRVGCMPCINAGKDEVLRLARLFPEQIERLAQWEEIVSQASKRSCATFFAASDDPTLEDAYPTLERFGIKAKVEWSKTSRGGKQYDMGRMIADFNTPCNEWGACES